MIWKLNILSCSYMFYSAEQTKGVSGFLLVPNILLFDSCPTLNSTISPQIRLHSNTQTRNSYCTLNHICSTWVEGKYLFPHSTHARICFFFFHLAAIQLFSLSSEIFQHIVQRFVCIAFVHPLFFLRTHTHTHMDTLIFTEAALSAIQSKVGFFHSYTLCMCV